jgi:hypothetical protein
MSLIKAVEARISTSERTTTPPVTTREFVVGSEP